MLKNFSIAVILLFFLSGIALATPVHFDVAGEANGSSVSVFDVDTFGRTSLSGSLVSGLDSTTFDLMDGESKTFEFFTLTASGIGFGSAKVSATLAFDSPFSLLGDGSGDAEWGTFFGLISGGELTWDSSTLPDTLTLADGTLLGVDFEDGVTLTLGDSATVHATVTNYGGAAPVPEPGTIILLGAGLAGLALYRRRKES